MTLNCWIRLISLVFVLGVLRPEAHADDLSGRTFKEAKALYTAERYEEALRRFMDTYVLKPSPSLLHNIAMAHWKQGHLREAHAYFLRYLQDPSLSVEQRATEERNLARVRENASGQGILLDENEGSEASHEEARRQALAFSGEGRTQYKAGNYAASVDRFRAAYLLHSEPRILQNLAMAYIKLGKKPEAVVLLTRYREEGKLTTEQQAQVDTLITDVQQGATTTADSLAEDESETEDALRQANRERKTSNNLNGSDGSSLERIPVYKKWWFWTAIAGGAIVVSLAIALPIVLTQRASDPCNESDWCVGVQAAPLRLWSIHPSH